MPEWVSTNSLYSAHGARKYLTGAERDRFIAFAWATARSEVSLLCLTLAYTGMRISEALDLRKAALDPTLGLIAVRSLKKRGRIHVRAIPVPACLLDALIATTETDFIWTLSRTQAWRLIKQVMVSADIPPGIHATPKGLRHAYGIHAILSRIPLNLLQRWLGHASMKTTAIYADAIGREEQEIAKRMW